MLIKTLFFVIPAHSDVHSAIPVAEELIARGGQAIFYLTDQFAPRVQRAGAGFRPLDPAVDLYDQLSAASPLTSMTDAGEVIERLGRLVSDLFMTDLRVVPAMIDDVRAERADCIVYNPMCPWGLALARMLDIPAVTLSTTFVMKPGSSFEQMFMAAPGADNLSGTWDAVRRCAKEMHDEHGIPPLGLSDMFSPDEDLNIVPLIREFQPDADELDDRYLFVGPSIGPRGDAQDFPLDRLAARPVLLISLGTSVSRGSGSRFAETCFEAFADSRWQVVLALGTGTAPEELGPVPSNFLIRTFVPQLEVLNRANLFVTHGGVNSVMEAVWFSVPMIAIPHTFEQLIIADRVAGLGLGLRLDPGEVTPAVLRRTAKEITTDPACRKQTAKLAAAARTAGGSRRAAEALLRTLDRRVIRNRVTGNTAGGPGEGLRPQ